MEYDSRLIYSKNYLPIITSSIHDFKTDSVRVSEYLAIDLVARERYMQIESTYDDTIYGWMPLTSSQIKKDEIIYYCHIYDTCFFYLRNISKALKRLFIFNLKTINSRHSEMFLISYFNDKLPTKEDINNLLLFPESNKSPVSFLMKNKKILVEAYNNFVNLFTSERLLNDLVID